MGFTCFCGHYECGLSSQSKTFKTFCAPMLSTCDRLTWYGWYYAKCKQGLWDMKCDTQRLLTVSLSLFLTFLPYFLLHRICGKESGQQAQCVRIEQRGGQVERGEDRRYHTLNSIVVVLSSNDKYHQIFIIKAVSSNCSPGLGWSSFLHLGRSRRDPNGYSARRLHQNPQVSDVI